LFGPDLKRELSAKSSVVESFAAGNSEDADESARSVEKKSSRYVGKFHLLVPYYARWCRSHRPRSHRNE
jgi:hypothetical protein